MPTVMLFQSTDASAPTLTGQTGSLIALLDACLVNGYGSKAAAGWTKSYSGTNKAAYRQGAGSQFYFRVDDSGPGAGGAKEARIVGYEAMTGIDAGTNPFPAAAQMANGLFIRKSAAADATARAWRLLATDKAVHLIIYSGDVANNATLTFFGDIVSLKPSDVYAAALIARATENSATATNDEGAYVGIIGNAAVRTGHYLARSHTGVGGSKQFACIAPGYMSAAGYAGGASALVMYPNGADGGYHLQPFTVVYDTVVRGTIPGIYAPCHNAPFSDGDTVGGAGAMSGWNFLVVGCMSAAQVAFETTANSWG
ncbi:MAG: hypothetical protein HQL51_03895 [Magnetococcales bacterium]|nr:hypothetical protein [Magnetococcales bacterium]